jgi:hypothetical protein
MSQPDGGGPSGAEALPIAMLMKVLLDQAGQVHALEVGEQQWNIVHSFGRDGECLAHAESVRESSQLVEI